MGIDLFKNRKLLIATKHQKEKVIAPLLEKHLGVNCFVDKNLDTDVLGTFTGEIEREQDPIATVRKKCLWAMEINNCDLGIASEGSFGPHPSIFFAPADDEFIIFIDKKNNLEIIARELSIETNFAGRKINSERELLDFAQSVKFPEHALILRKSKEETTDIRKGIADPKDLKTTFNALLLKHKMVYAETDMRAFCNPSRMRVIATATEKLIQKIKSTCNVCQKPGFGIIDAKRGLPCSLCSSPTNSILSHIYKCQHCQFEKEEMYPNKKTMEDPMYCNFCNP